MKQIITTMGPKCPIALSKQNIEVWLPIPAYENWYEVSNLGRIRSLERIVIGRPGVIGKKYSQFLKPLAGEDYARVVLAKNSVRKTIGIHQLVLLAFCGPCPPKHEVRHLDNVKRNNALYNICYGTKKTKPQ
jgi:NUMOD4 motif/HNH endonuclease